jgi:hypothetical protein
MLSVASRTGGAIVGVVTDPTGGVLPKVGVNGPLSCPAAKRVLRIGQSKCAESHPSRAPRAIPVMAVL